MDTLIQLVVSGLALGAIYALVALGFVVIYRASKVFNFAQGDFLTVGAFLMSSLASAGVPWGIALIGSMAGTGLLSAAVERLMLRRMIGRPVFVTIILTIFVGILLRTVIMMIWGPTRRGMPTPWDPMAAAQVGGASILVNSLVAIGAGAVAFGLFFYLVLRTRFGVAMRATSQDQEVALALGIPVGRIFGATWFLAGAYAALGGVFLGMFPRDVDPNLGFIALRAFPAVIVGGLESPLGTVIAGVLLGLAEILAQGYVNPHLGEFGHNFHAVFPYLIMILFLVIRPYGLFGRKDVKRA